MECRQCGQEWCCTDPDDTHCTTCNASDARLLGVESERGLALYAPAVKTALAQENAELRAEVTAQQTKLERLRDQIKRDGALIQAQSDEIERLRAELEEAREAAAEFAGYRPPMAADLRDWLRRFPWLKKYTSTA